MKFQKIIIFGLIGLIIPVLYGTDAYAQTESEFNIPDVNYGDTLYASGKVDSNIDEVFVRIKNSCDSWIGTYRLSTNDGAFEKNEIAIGSDWKYTGNYQGFLFVNQKSIATENFVVTNPSGVSPDDCPEKITETRSTTSKNSDNSVFSSQSQSKSPRVLYMESIDKGILYRDSGNLDFAMRFFQIAINAKPDLSGGYVQMGLTFMSLAKFDDSLEYFQKALLVSPDDEEIEQYVSDVTLLVAIQRGEIPAEFSTLSIYNFTDNGVKHYYNGKYVEALEQFQLALAINEYDVKALTTSGLALAQLKDYDKAIEFYEAALKLTPNDDTIVRHKALATSLRDDTSPSVFASNQTETEIDLKVPNELSDERRDQQEIVTIHEEDVIRPVIETELSDERRDQQEITTISENKKEIPESNVTDNNQTNDSLWNIGVLGNIQDEEFLDQQFNANFEQIDTGIDWVDNILNSFSSFDGFGMFGSDEVPIEDGSSNVTVFSESPDENSSAPSIDIDSIDDSNLGIPIHTEIEKIDLNSIIESESSVDNTINNTDKNDCVLGFEDKGCLKVETSGIGFDIKYTGPGIEDKEIVEDEPIDILGTAATNILSVGNNTDSEEVISEPEIISESVIIELKIIIEPEEIIEPTIFPPWLKQTANFWCQDNIDGYAFLTTIQYLKETEVITANEIEHDDTLPDKIPLWLKTDACLWYEDEITDEEFLTELEIIFLWDF